MSNRLSPICRAFGAFVFAVVAVLSYAPPSVHGIPPLAVAQRYYPEVRLRKLHLVRPDLIPFPLDFDVYC